MYDHRRQVPKIIFTRPKSPGLGHLALKSSVFAPTAMSFMGQDYVFNHMKSHYRRIASAKAAVDTTPPRALTSNIKAQDKKRREELKNSPRSPTVSPRPSTSRSARSKGFAQDRYSPRDTGVEYEEFSRTASRNSLNFDDSLLDLEASRTQEDQGKKSRMSERQDRFEMQLNDSRGMQEQYSTPSVRTPMDKARMSLGDNYGTRMTSSQQSNYTCRQTPRSPQRTTRDPHLVIWENDQKYLKFIQEVTADVLARGIFSDRVLNKVFEGHIEKNRNELDEERMCEMIEQLKIDLGVGNGS